MASLSASALTRYRPSVIVSASLAAAASLYFAYCIVSRAQEVPHGSLHRSNAIRRRHGSAGRVSAQDLENLDQLIQSAQQALTNATNETNSAVAAVEANIPQPLADLVEAGVANEAETEQDLEDPAQAQEGSRLQELVYSIAKSNSEKEGIVHRGVTCDKCSRVPIVGVRYHCANCPDFDLCEDCEATDCHLKTHVFYKVKVPSPWGGKKPLPLWYPGDPAALPAEIEDRAYKNRLSSLSGFMHSKIDGLYQQFTCMANVPVDLPDQKSIRMGIDRIAFDHCFIGQTMTDRRPVPNLIHECLFSFYDSNRDGVVDFTEFVIGTSLVHNKDKHVRNKRVFSGLDLDHDGFISRKDCLKIFRAYYELNKDIMLGYLGIEREGENADLVLAEREPSRHISSGRSLASYFNEGAPGGLQINSGTSEKVLDPYNDYVPFNDFVEPITGDETTNAFDLLTKDEVAENGWLNFFTVFNDEVFRACGGKPLRWLNETHVRVFSRTSLRGSKRDMIEHNGQLWAADAVYFGKSAYLSIEDDDMRGIWTAAEYRSKLSDPTFHLTVHAVARHRLCLVIREAMLDAGKAKKEEREENSLFYLEEELGFSKEQKPADPNLQINSEERQHEDSTGVNSVVEGINSNDISDDYEKWQPSTFVGGSAAAHTIYNVVEDALIELLDPLFKPSERVFLEVENSSLKRERYGDQIAALRHKLIEDYIAPFFTGSKRAVSRRTTNTESRQSTKKDKDDAFKAFNAHLKPRYRFWNDPEFITSALEYYFSEVQMHVEPNSELETFLTWLLAIEAETAAGRDVYRLWKTGPGSKARAQEMQDDEDSSGHPSPDWDPTMPQYRPSATAAEDELSEDELSEDGFSDELPEHEMLRLARLDAVAEQLAKRPAAGLLDFTEFERKMELTEDNGDLLLQWIGGWVDLVMF